MSFLCGVIQVGSAWLTAVMILVAGVPHFDCLCPTGQRKAFCLGFSSKATGCCCSGSCCCGTGDAGSCCCRTHAASPPARTKMATSCCKCHGHGVVKTPDSKPLVKGTGCRKTLVHADFAAVTGDRTSAGEDLTPANTLASSQSPRILGSPEVAGLRLCWQSYRLPPPTDLVITLQHFVI